jgi:hypothetical protein
MTAMLFTAQTAAVGGSKSFSELFQQGVTKYLGQYSPALTEQVGDSLNHRFKVDDGPLCLYGGQYMVSTRDKKSNDLLIFLPGGGGCWSEHCSHIGAIEAGVPSVGILNPDLDDNPVKSWNTAYLPYCDGSLFSGDVDLDLDNDNVIDRYHRGHKNLSAGLDLIANTFPNPKRILIAGLSAGGYATAYTLPLVRHLYPDVPIFIINDSGVGALRPGLFQIWVKEWKSQIFFPASCPNCLNEKETMINFHSWLLAQDENVYLGMLSYKQDMVMVKSLTNKNYEHQLVSTIKKLESLYPTRVRGFLPSGERHTLLYRLSDIKSGDMLLTDWIEAMLKQWPEWVSLEN